MTHAWAVAADSSDVEDGTAAYAVLQTQPASAGARADPEHGSSPHAWGTRGCVPVGARGAGFIATCVGNTQMIGVMSRALLALGLAALLLGGGELAGCLWSGAIACVAIWLLGGPRWRLLL